MIPVPMMRSLFSRYIASPFYLIKFFFVAPTSAPENPQVVEHAAPLAAEVGQEFLDALAKKGRKDKGPAEDAGTNATTRVRKAPAPEAGTGQAPPAKRQKKTGSGPGGRKRRHEIPVASG
jgi:hypothetical protein